MKLAPVVEFDSQISDFQELGETAFGERKIYVVGGGRFWGDKLNGSARPGGADWVLVNSAGLARLDVRKTIETDDGALIYMSYQGWYQFDEKITENLAQGIGYQFGDTLFQVQVQFETGDSRYQWLNTTLAVAEGRETGGGIHYRVYALQEDDD